MEGSSENSRILMAELRHCLEYLGLPRHGSKKSSFINFIVHTTTTLLLLSSIVPQLILVFSEKYTLLERTQALAITTPMVRCMFKILHRVYTMDKLWDLYDDLQTMYDAGIKYPTKRAKLQAREKDARFLFKCFISFYTALFVLFNIVPLVLAAIFYTLGYPTGLNLPFVGEYYFDVSENPAFAIIYTIQAMASIVTLYPAIWDSIFLSLTIYVLAQLEIMTIEFQNLNRYKYMQEDNHHSESSRAVRFKHMIGFGLTAFENNLNKPVNIDQDIESLKRCIRQHETIIQLAKKLESVFGMQMAVECLIASVISCLSMFQVSVAPEFLLKCKYFCLAAFFYAGFYVTVHHGQKLINESAALEKAIYNLPWVDRGVEYTRMVAFVLHRSQEPLGVTALYFFSISSETFLRLLKASFSYFALLQTVAEDK